MTQDNIAATGEGDDYWEREGRRIRERLGQPAEVVAKVRLYLRMPAWFATQKASAVELLGLCGDEGVPMLIEVLDDRGQPVSDRFTQPTRSAAARALGRLRARVAVEPLEKALVTKYPDVRKTSARALGLIGDERSVDALSSLLANDDDVNVRLDTVRALAAMNKVELVVMALKDGSASVRREAAWCLGMMNAAQAVGGLVQVLRDEDWNVRIWGIRALAKIGGARALEALQTCLNDPDPRVKECAEQAVYELKLKLKESGVLRNAPEVDFVRGFASECSGPGEQNEGVGEENAAHDAVAHPLAGGGPRRGRDRGRLAGCRISAGPITTYHPPITDLSGTYHRPKSEPRPCGIDGWVRRMADLSQKEKHTAKTAATSYSYTSAFSDVRA